MNALRIALGRKPVTIDLTPGLHGVERITKTLAQDL